MCQENHMTRMADGLFVLGSSIKELLVNFRECLQRLIDAGLTLKPSKVEIVPQQSTLLGWTVNGKGWSPPAHTTSALARAPRPKTVTQLRSFLGSLKQLHQGIPRQRSWRPASSQSTDTPRPKDKLNTYSDWSEEHRAVGGCLEI